ncbi:hypothetical protein H5410_016831 [Solanum commersonii]|uniref:Uncharacterized protein n=1 Tax=Solanum commersonii TaxID=4109 RepID=A0A9J5ZYT9_SOLCO|nr:hypothetical protein H5410_016831 [Solanum commersonii]
METWNLMDLDLAGGELTWRRGDRHSTAARLDRFLISEEWDSNFRNIKQSVLQIMGTTKSYFKFENWWLTTDGFNDRVKTWWESFRFHGKPEFVLVAKLRALTAKLKEWSKTRQGNLCQQKQLVLNQLAEFEMIQDQRILEEEEIASKLALTAEFEEMAKKEEAAWRQRSRAVWFKQGDRNTSFFHKTANAHRRVNIIDKIKVRDELLTEPAEIQKEITEYYEKLYAETEDWRPDLEMIGCPTIDKDDTNQLMAPFKAQEILEGIKACAGDKAPGPDGFSMAFFSQCWEVIKKEVVAVVQNFHEEGVFEKSINATFVTLIPKKTGGCGAK